MVFNAQPSLLAPRSASFGKGGTIYCQGDDDGRWFEVVRGVVRTCRFLADGRRHLTSFCYPGDVFGIERGPHGDAAEAVTEVEVLTWQGWQKPAVALPTSEIALYRALASARRAMFMFGRRTADERLAAFLLTLSDRAGSLVVDLPMTRADIADYLGLTLHTVSRTISDFARRGLIALQGPQHLRILEDQALRQLAGEADANPWGGEEYVGSSEGRVEGGSAGVAELLSRALPSSSAG